MTAKPRIIFVNRFFYPDRSATSQILSDLAFALAKDGFAITVVTSKLGHSADLRAAETVSGVDIVRVGRAGVRSRNLMGRSIEYLQYYAFATWLLFSIVKPGDILVAKTDPPLISVFAALVARCRSGKLVNWMQDLYPEVADKLGLPFARGPIGWILRRARDFSLRSARVNVVIGSRMAVLLRGHLVGNEITIIPNWVDDRAIRPLAASGNPFLKGITMNGEFVVGYSGNLGRAHEFETLLNAARLLADKEDILFLFIGGGRYLSVLKSKVDAEGLGSRFRFLPTQPLEDLKFSLPAPNVHWISLRPELEGLIVPSKIYGVLAAGRPTIAIMAKDGEISRLLERYGCGIVVDPGDSVSLAREILRLKNDPDVCAAMGRRARKLLENKFTRQNAIEQWTGLLRGL